MQSTLHASVLEHAQRISELRSISLSEAVDRLAEVRPYYLQSLPLFTKWRERRPPFAVTPYLVRTLNSEAKKLRKQSNIQLAAALDAAAFHAGFHDWKHVIKMANAYELTVETPVKSGFAFAMWYPQNPWDEKKWNPRILESSGFVHDPRLFFSTAEDLKNSYSNEDADGGFYGLGYPVTKEDGSVEMRTRTEAYLEELRADVYVENNLPGLHFFRYTGMAIPATLDEARTLLEDALGPVRWNIREPSFPPEPVSLSVAIEMMMSKEPNADLPPTLPPIGDKSNISLHIPIVHYVWLKGEFVVLDEYYF